MPALLKEATVREGKKKRLACNARCYNAKRELCACPCGGVNHGVGLQVALENTKRMKAEGKAGVEFNEKVLGAVKLEEVKVPAVILTDCPVIKRPRDAKGHFIKVVKA